MRLAIIGSRNCPHVDIEALLKYIPDTIVSGGARGADTFTREFAKKHNLMLMEFLPEYDKYPPKQAPLIRNKQIIENCDCVLALWDGQSRGTKFTIDYAIQNSKPVKIYNYTTDESIKIYGFVKYVNMEVFYHGSTALFNKFDMSHALEGDGKMKFGYGVYLTSNMRSAAHYSGANKSVNSQHYVYSVLIPELTENNYIAFKNQVHPSIINKAEHKLHEPIPYKVTLDGKDFRKYLAKTLAGNVNTEGEKMASEFLLSIGVEYIIWPYSWRNPHLGTNRAVLDPSKVQIVKIHSVELDSKQQLISGSQEEIPIPQ